jgi:N-acetylmuramoyl-L-alanine amidase
VKLGVVVGHTTKAQGAMLGKPYDFVSEYEYHTMTAANMIAIGEHEGVEVLLAFRDDLGIQGAYKALEKRGAQACIELHFNSFNETTEGTETLYGQTPMAQAWASKVQAHMLSLYHRAGKQDRGIKLMKRDDRGGFNVNQAVSFPCVLIEPFFGDDPDEARRAISSHVSLAQTLVRAFKSFMDDLNRPDAA